MRGGRQVRAVEKPRMLDRGGIAMGEQGQCDAISGGKPGSGMGRCLAQFSPCVYPGPWTVGVSPRGGGADGEGGASPLPCLHAPGMTVTPSPVIDAHTPMLY